MSTIRDRQEEEQSALAVVGRTVVGGDSSLTKFALRFDDATALLIEASGDPEAPGVSLSLVAESELPPLSEAVCSVDWHWIAGSRIEHARLGPGRLTLTLSPAGPLDVSALVWQGAPFLAFQPYKPAAG